MASVRKIVEPVPRPCTKPPLSSWRQVALGNGRRQRRCHGPGRLKPKPPVSDRTLPTGVRLSTEEGVLGFAGGPDRWAWRSTSFYSAALRVAKSEIPSPCQRAWSPRRPKWGPLPNHFGEPVIGAALSSGRAPCGRWRRANPALHPVCIHEVQDRPSAGPRCFAWSMAWIGTAPLCRRRDHVP